MWGNKYVYAFSLQGLQIHKFASAVRSAESIRIVSLEQTLCNEEDQLLVKSIENEAGYIGRRLKTDARVPGNIHKAEFRQFWESELETSDMVLSTIRNGYSLPFRILPPPSHEGNNASAKKDMEFVIDLVGR